jgi:replicative DNA helicase
MRSDAYESDILVYLFNSDDGLAKFAESLEPEHFQNEVYGALYDLMKQHWLKHREKPTLVSIETEIVKELESSAPRFFKEDIPVVTKVLEAVINNKYIAGKWIDSDLTKWLREAEYKTFTEKANFSLHEGRPDKIDDLWRSMQQKLVHDGSGEGLVFFEEWDAILKNYLDWSTDRIIETMYLDLNAILGGGLYKGEFGLVWGPPNVGKSFMLNNMGFGACKDYRVLHLTNEMSEMAIAVRYMTMQSDIPKQEFADSYKQAEMKRVHNMVQTNMKRNLVIRYVSPATSPNVLAGMLEKAKANSEPFDLVLIDYLDNFDLKGVEQDWLKLEKICQIFSDVAKEYNVCIVAATHCDQGAYGKRIVSNKHLNRSKTGKDKVIDFSLFLGQDAKDMETHTVIVTVTKMRDREGKGRSCALMQVFETGKFKETQLPADLLGGTK